MSMLISESPLQEFLRHDRRTWRGRDADRWTARVGTEGDASATVRQTSEWMVATAKREADSTLRTDDLLPAAVASGALPCGWKCAFDSDGRSLIVRAEWPEASLSHGPEELARKFDALDRIMDGVERTEADAPGSTSAAMPEGDHSPLPPLVESSGWPCHPRAGGRVATPLETGAAYCEAIVERIASGRIHAAYELHLGELSSRSLLAGAVLALRANRIHRMARLSLAYADRSDGRFNDVKARWDVSLPPLADAGDLATALAALSVLCRRSVRELQALADERTAGAFLEVQGMVPDRFE